MKQDFLDWIEENEEALIEDHLDVWKDKYYRRTAEWVEYALGIDYDWSGDIEWCENDLGRKLDDEEKEYFAQYFTKQIPERFYLRF